MYEIVRTYQNPSCGEIAQRVRAILVAAWLVLPAVGFARGVLARDMMMVVIAALLFFLLWFWPVSNALFRRCYEVQLGDEGACDFRSAFRTTRLRVHEITTIRPTRWQDAYEDVTVVEYRRGKLFLVQPIIGFSDFLTQLQAQNPLVKVRLSSDS